MIVFVMLDTPGTHGWILKTEFFPMGKIPGDLNENSLHNQSIIKLPNKSAKPYSGYS